MLLGTKRRLFLSDEGRSAFLKMVLSVLAIAVGSARDLLDGSFAGVQTAAALWTSEIARVLI